MPRQTSFQMTQATERQVAALHDAGFGSTTDIIRIAVDRMAREEIAIKSIIAERAGISRQDTNEVIARKLRAWLSKNMPEATPDQTHTQAEIAWQGIMATWGERKRIFEFEASWNATN